VQTPVRIRHHHVKPSEALTRLIERRAKALERYFARITGCEVTVEGPEKHHHKGKHFRVRIEVSVPGERLVVGRDPAKTRQHEDLYAAVQGAFREARRQLLDHARRIDGRVKVHGSRPRAVVTRLFPEGYGFLETPDGREIYFNAHSVLGRGFAALEVGTRVRYAEEAGEKGPQASTVLPAASSRHAVLQPA